MKGFVNNSFNLKNGEGYKQYFPKIATRLGTSWLHEGNLSRGTVREGAARYVYKCTLKPQMGVAEEASSHTFLMNVIHRDVKFRPSEVQAVHNSDERD